ncbi:MAG: hypothetical protein M1823_004077 [Watsoniomyces obsoletus]|nr:MAG: hypothetical protein M1823_004077 [Watsoniomyces obsoletus]
MTTPTPTPIPDDDHPISDPPLPISASVILTSLPRDAHAALHAAAAASGQAEPSQSPRLRGDTQMSTSPSAARTASGGEEGNLTPKKVF